MTIKIALAALLTLSATSAGLASPRIRHIRVGNAPYIEQQRPQYPVSTEQDDTQFVENRCRVLYGLFALGVVVMLLAVWQHLEQTHRHAIEKLESDLNSAESKAQDFSDRLNHINELHEIEKSKVRAKETEVEALSAKLSELELLLQEINELDPTIQKRVTDHRAQLEADEEAKLAREVEAELMAKLEAEGQARIDKLLKEMKRAG